jgi:hypothetical protein
VCKEGTVADVSAKRHPEVDSEEPVRQTSAVSENSSNQSFLTTLRDEILLIGFLVSFVGLVYTDAYYSDFGIRYQLLALPTYHIVYAGLTAVVELPWLVLVYAVPAMLVNFDWFSFTSLRFSSYLRNTFLILFVPLLLGSSYWLARIAGNHRYERDVDEDRSTLPRLVRLQVEHGPGFDRHDGMRVLMVDSDYIIIFQPQKGRGAVPHIQRFLKGDVHVFDTTR